MVNMDATEDLIVEPPHCVGCENYGKKVRENSRPKEFCKIARMEINNGYIARRSEERCPKGRGKYGKSRNRNAELYGDWPNIPVPDRFYGRPRLVPDVYSGGEEARPGVVPPERAYPGVGVREDSVREGRGVVEALIAQARQVEHDHRVRGAFIPDGYRIEAPYMSHPEPMWSMESYAVQSSVQIRTARIVFSHLNGWTLEG